VNRRIIILFRLALLAPICLTLILVAPLRAANAQQGQLNLIRDAEIESTIRTFITPIWQVAGLNPEAVSIVLVQDNSLNAFVAGGQRIFINTGLLLRTERPAQVIGVLAHETGHIAGGHLARQQEELRNLSTMQILEVLLGGAAAVGGGLAGGRGGAGGSVTGPGGQGIPGSLSSFLRYSQTQESAADQASITFLERAHETPRGTLEFLKILEHQERLTIGRPTTPYLTTHPLTPDRIATFEDAVAHSPYANTPDSPKFIELHRRMIAKLLGFTAPDAALQRYPEGDRSVPARYGRAIALYRKGTIGSALLTLDGLLKEYPDDPYFHELRGQILFENGRVDQAVVSYRRAVQLSRAPIIKIDFARALIETNKPDADREAVRNLDIAVQSETDSWDLWRLEATAYSRMGNEGMTSLARAEMAVLRGQRSEAQAHAAAAIRQLPAGTPAWQRAQDIQAFVASRSRRN
jgi:predicted Zn-dependent protease